MKSTDEIKYVDAVKAFEINEDMECRLHFVNNLPIVESFNVYKYPDMVRDILVSTPVSSPYNQKGHGGFAGKRGMLSNFIDNPNYYIELNRRLNPLLKTSSMLKRESDIFKNNGEFMFNVFDVDPTETNPDRFLSPHADFADIASILYLNNKDEMPSGTILYGMKKTQSSFVPASDNHFAWYKKMSGKSTDEINKETAHYRKIIAEKDNTKGYILKDDEDFEILFEASGEYNSMVSYVGGMIHGPNIQHDQIRKSGAKRINQVIFLSDLDNND